MTIAACYVSPEGVVFGADSTTTFSFPGAQHYFNHSQKLFEIGQNSTLAGMTWGLGGLLVTSYRALFAKLGDDLAATPPTSVEAVIKQWIATFWVEYQNSKSGSLKDAFDAFNTLNAKAPHNSQMTPSSSMRTAEEEEQYVSVTSSLTAGFCLGGYVPKDRKPSAWHVTFLPSNTSPPTPEEVPSYDPRFWGAPNYFLRLADGSDPFFRQEILNSPFWTGTDQDLLSIAQKYALGHQALPIRDAIDYVYTCISSTIKALKFSSLPQICGGPIELAVITADRPFRWVRHKEFDAAIMHGGT